MAYQRKTRDYYSIEQLTAEGWEEVTAEETRKAAARSVREYRDNQPEYSVRFRRKREPIDWIKEVCDLFDVQIIRDLCGGESLADAKPCFALGQRSELSAGLRGFAMTPYFETPEELERFCARHIQRFRAIIADDPEAPAPDASDWDLGNKIA